MTIWGRVTFYKICRDHSDRTAFFVISVPESGQYGLGVQVNIRSVLYGLSLHTKGTR